MDELLSVREVARRLGVSRARVKQLLWRHGLGVTIIGPERNETAVPLEHYERLVAIRQAAGRPPVE